MFIQYSTEQYIIVGNQEIEEVEGYNYFEHQLNLFNNFNGERSRAESSMDESRQIMHYAFWWPHPHEHKRTSFQLHGLAYCNIR